MRQAVPRSHIANPLIANPRISSEKRTQPLPAVVGADLLRRSPVVTLPLVLSVLLFTLLAHDTAPAVAYPVGQQAVRAPVLSTQHTDAAASVAPGGFVVIGDSVHPANMDAHTPSLAIQPDSTEPWVAVVQNDHILVSKYNSSTDLWQQQAGILNRGSANHAANPSLTFAGNNRETPWVAWQEEVDGVNLINASFFNGTTWNLTPLLNRDPARNATEPVIVAGTTISGALPLPWVAWGEATATGAAQLVVDRAQNDNRAQGGFAWLPVGDTLNFSSTRSALSPALAFAGPGKTTPWIVWREAGGETVERVYAKRWDGATWSAVGRQEDCSGEVGCALNTNAQVDAAAIRVASGRLPNENSPTPWLVFQEVGLSGDQEIRVLRLDVGNPADDGDDRFIPVGGAVNAQCLGNAGVSAAAANNVDVRSAGLRDSSAATEQAATSGGNASEPTIYFVGNVPHVAWVESHGPLATLYVCHLADGRSGLERWDLDTIDGVNQTIAPVTHPQLVANATTPYISWQETVSETVVYVARRSPAGPAWGANFPAHLTDIAGAGSLAAGTLDAAAVSAPQVRSNPVSLVTAAYHVNGVAGLEEVQLQLLPRVVATTTARAGTANSTPVLLARYVISDNLLYVQDPENPGTFFPPVTPGNSGSNINTPYVTVVPSNLSVRHHGAPSAALDITWALIFEDATFFHEYTQAINIIHDGGEETGFFQVGTVYVGSRVYMPVVMGE